MSSQYRSDLREAAEFIRSRDDFLVVSHVNPDGDATGSATAMAGILQSLGKKVTLVNEGETPEKFLFLPFSQQIHNYSLKPLDRTFTSVIAVDSADRERLGNVTACFANEAKILNIDHHPTNDRYGDVNAICENAAATAVVIFDLLKEMDIPMNRDIAQCLYTGLLTDTGGFRYSNTSSRVFEIASELVRYDVSPAKVAERCLETITYPHVKLLQEALTTLEVEENGLVASIEVTQEMLNRTQASEEDVEGIVNYARNLQGVEVGLLFKERNHDEVKVSFRSNSSVDVSAIAQAFGGGGHIRASGCTVRKPLSQVKLEVTAAVREAVRQA